MRTAEKQADTTPDTVPLLASGERWDENSEGEKARGAAAPDTLPLLAPGGELERRDENEQAKASNNNAPPTKILGERYMSFWLEDYPPMSGRLRLIFHLGLWYFAATNYKRMFLYMMSGYEATDPEMFTPRGLLGFLGFGHIDPGILRAIIALTKVAYVSSAIGLFTGASSAVVAACSFFLHGYFMDISGGNRGWYVPTASLVAMCFAANKRGDPWSVDYHLQRWRQGNGHSHSDAQTGSNYFAIRETGFARKCLLVYVVGFYCSSGLAKLYASGLRWADGLTLQHYMGNHDNIYAQLMVEHRSLAVIGSAGALFLEAGAFLALFSKRIRVLFMIGWAMMHIMIKLSMGRKYSQNAWCYILLVDWGELYLWAKAIWMKTKRLTNRSLVEKDAAAFDTSRRESMPRIGEVPGIRRSSAKFATIVGTCLLLSMTAQSLLQIDWWPFTNVDMYSAYFHSDIKHGFPKSTYTDAVGAQNIARSWGNRQAKGDLAEGVEIQLRKEGYDKKKGKKEIEPFGVERSKQWRKSVFTKVIVEDFRAKPKGTIAFDPEHPDNPASAFLLHILPSLKRNVKHWNDYDYFVLTYELDGPDPIIASIPLNDSELDQLVQTHRKLRKESRRGSKHSKKLFVFFCIAGLGIASYFTKVRIRAFAKNYHSNQLPMHQTAASKSQN